jgi:hypothetical protein
MESRNAEVDFLRAFQGCFNIKWDERGMLVRGTNSLFIDTPFEPALCPVFLPLTFVEFLAEQLAATETTFIAICESQLIGHPYLTNLTTM